MKNIECGNDELLGKLFEFLVNNGLENAHIRDMCKNTNVAQGSLYYRFGDKTNIICKATEYGIKKITDNVIRGVCKPSMSFSKCEQIIKENQKALRFIYQAAVSPAYGKRIRKSWDKNNSLYDKYAEKLSVIHNINKDALYPIVYLYISAVMEYAVWDDKVKLKSQFDFLASILLRAK